MACYERVSVHRLEGRPPMSLCSSQLGRDKTTRAPFDLGIARALIEKGHRAVVVDEPPPGPLRFNIREPRGRTATQELNLPNARPPATVVIHK